MGVLDFLKPHKAAHCIACSLKRRVLLLGCFGFVAIDSVIYLPPRKFVVVVDKLSFGFWDLEVLLGSYHAIFEDIAIARVRADGIDTLFIYPHRVVVGEVVVCIALFVGFKEIAPAKREKFILLEA